MRNWIKKNGAIVAVLVMVASTLTVQLFGFKLRYDPSAPTPEIVIVPEDDPTVFGPAVAKDSHLSARGERALRLAGVFLRNRGEGRGTLFAAFQKIHNDPAALERAEKAAQAAPVGIDPITLSILIKIAVMIATEVLERVAPNTPNEWDDRLLALLKLFARNPAAISAAAEAA